MERTLRSLARTILHRLGGTLLLSAFLVTSTLAFGATYHVIRRFDAGKGGGATAYAGLVLDTTGNLYGTASKGESGFGVVFRLQPLPGGAYKEVVLYNFTGGRDGSTPAGRVTLDSAGNVYGTTAFGGDPACSCGLVFMLKPGKTGKWKETVLHAFTDSADGSVPNGDLIFDAAGNLYGTTFGGGGHFDGTLFRLSPSGHGAWNETVLYAFGDGAAHPNGPLVFDAASQLYGTSSNGGAFDLGTVFRLSPGTGDTWTETVLYEFGDRSWAPTGGVIFDSAGSLYGTAMFGPFPDFCGGNGCGVVFQLAPDGGGGWNYTNIYVFHGHHDGAFPAAGLTFDAAGNLYGTTTLSGHDDDIVNVPDHYGTVFELTKGSGGWQETILHRFGTPNRGAHPQCTLLLDSGGTIYGTAPDGGLLGQGVAFKIVP